VRFATVIWVQYYANGPGTKRWVEGEDRCGWAGEGGWRGGD
jgi:hypothetical protein